jgi:proteasome lid subunit RPN8/RPN11
MSKKTQQAASVSVVIDGEVLRNIRQHARSELDTEICGVLIGSSEQNLSLISASIPGLAAEQAGTHVTFTQDTWQHIYEVKDRDFPDDRIIGWYHSHPGFGVFLSDHDTFIHRNFFSAPGQIAWVFDPVSDEEGCFIWQGKEIHRAEKIMVSDPKGGEDTDERSEPALSEVCVESSSKRASSDPHESPGMSYLGWSLIVLSYIAVFGLGIILSLYVLIPPERVVLIPADPATGQPLDPRLREPNLSIAPSAPKIVTPEAQTPAATLPPAHVSGAQPRKDQSGKQ